MDIYVNQVGYKPKEKKVAICLLDDVYKLVDAKTKEIIMTLKASKIGYDDASGDDCFQLDFSNFENIGSYYIMAEDGTKSDTFEIRADVYNELQLMMTKALYYQRCGCALEEKYAGVYKHAACHTNDAILYEDFEKKTIHPKKYEMTGGWHDAGDFGRYSSPAAVALGHLLYAYELFPESFCDTLNIPESGNGIPDILNECRYELDWLMKMQREDGGVYHKLTAYRHAPFVMPEEDKDQFLLYPVSSMAVADFTAIMAIASRVYKAFDSAFSKKALEASRKSFEWLTNNDYVGFVNPEGSGTGDYRDESDKDERMWAAAELLRTDREGDVKAYRDMLEMYVFSDIPKTDFGWTDVSGFAMLACLTDESHSAGKQVETVLKDALFEEVERLLKIMQSSGYKLALKKEDFVWGSNMVICNRGMLFILANWLTDDERYLEAAYNQMHYLLGRNALGRSYVTGFGEHAYHNPHNRPTAMDGIDEPMSGWVSGGPFKNPCDEDAVKMIPKGTPPMKCHADVVGSYSTNEITIYWNSPAIFMTAYFNRDIDR